MDYITCKIEAHFAYMHVHPYYIDSTKSKIFDVVDKA